MDKALRADTTRTTAVQKPKKGGFKAPLSSQSCCPQALWRACSSHNDKGFSRTNWTRFELSCDKGVDCLEGVGKRLELVLLDLTQFLAGFMTNCHQWWTIHTLQTSPEVYKDDFHLLEWHVLFSIFINDLEDWLECTLCKSADIYYSPSVVVCWRVGLVT